MKWGIIPSYAGSCSDHVARSPETNGSMVLKMNLKEKLQLTIDNKTKPVGALGDLESVALKIGLIQKTHAPELRFPHIVVFAADHGIAQEGVSAYPPEVTHQMVLNFLNGGAAINVFCRQHGIALKIADAGVAFDFTPHPDLIVSKPGKGSRNMMEEPAMGVEELKFSLDQGAEIVKNISETGCNIIGFGEMGIGNTSSASLLISALLDIPIDDCVGKGTGISPGQLVKKQSVLKSVQKKHGIPEDPEEVLRIYGGLEIAQMCGAMEETYRQGMVLLIDGFIATAALCVAVKKDNTILDNCIFCHQSEEQAHKMVLKQLNVHPLLHLNMRLGEGTGCALAFPLIESAVRFFNEMASFEGAQISTKS